MHWYSGVPVPTLQARMEQLPDGDSGAGGAAASFTDGDAGGVDVYAGGGPGALEHLAAGTPAVSASEGSRSR